MRAVVQRVSRASVLVDGKSVGNIESGLLVYLGVASEDQDPDLIYLADKVRHLRIFIDQDGRLNLDVGQVGGSVLVVSAFTVQADARRGRRPSFEGAAPREQAVDLYERFCDELQRSGVEVQRGLYGAHMNVDSINDGPICVLLDSKKVF